MSDENININSWLLSGKRIPEILTTDASTGPAVHPALIYLVEKCGWVEAARLQHMEDGLKQELEDARMVRRQGVLGTMQRAVRVVTLCGRSPWEGEEKPPHLSCSHRGGQATGAARPGSG